MYNYEDLIEVGENDIAKARFCRRAVDDFKSSREYHEAVAGEAYYHKHNLTIENFQKFLYTLSGATVPDIFSANYKLKTTFFRRLVQQQIQYVLGNGVILENPNNKEKLGKNFDFQMTTMAKRAMAAGRAFGFWNNDHLEVFGYADTPSDPGFCPLYSEKDSSLMAGIRFWAKKVGDKMIYRTTLFEIDGYTEYRQEENQEPEVLNPKKAYKKVTVASPAGGVESVVDENYTKLPIVCLYVNDSHESELVGMRENIDCYDYVKSGLANDIDDTSGFYWIIKNAGGMDEPDLARFIQRLRTVKATALDDDGAEAEAHTLDVPFEARKAMLEILRNDIYEDFQALDVKSLSAAAKTTQEIQAAFQAQDNKCADFEYYILDFVQKILELAGIKDTPRVIWNKMINQPEETNMVLSAANYLTDEAVIKHLPFLTPEEADAIIKERKAEEYKSMNDEPEDDREDEKEEDDSTKKKTDEDLVKDLVEENGEPEEE